jgi:hypothetical protein
MLYQDDMRVNKDDINTAQYNVFNTHNRENKRNSWMHASISPEYQNYFNFTILNLGLYLEFFFHTRVSVALMKLDNGQMNSFNRLVKLNFLLE